MIISEGMVLHEPRKTCHCGAASVDHIGINSTVVDKRNDNMQFVNSEHNLLRCSSPQVSFLPEIASSFLLPHIIYLFFVYFLNFLCIQVLHIEVSRGRATQPEANIKASQTKQTNIN